MGNILMDHAPVVDAATDGQNENIDGVQFKRLSKLAEMLQRLSPDEQEVLLGFMNRVTFDDEPLTETNLMTKYLRFFPEMDDTSVLQQIRTKTAPPVFKEYPDCEQIALPRQMLPINYTLPEVLRARASRRDLSKGYLSQEELSTLLHYTYGIRGRKDFVYNSLEFPMRFVPTSGGLQSPEIYLVVNAVQGLAKGLYHYYPPNQSLHLLEKGLMRRKLLQCAQYTTWLEYASVVLIVTGKVDRLYWKYGRRAYRMTHMDIGIVSYNAHLVANALRLRSCLVAGYVDGEVNRLLNIDGLNEFTGLLIGIGRKPWEDHPPAPEDEETGQQED